jgi:hypothetical protein
MREQNSPKLKKEKMKINKMILILISVMSVGFSQAQLHWKESITEILSENVADGIVDLTDDGVRLITEKDTNYYSLINQDSNYFYLNTKGTDWWGPNRELFNNQFRFQKNNNYSISRYDSIVRLHKNYNKFLNVEFDSLIIENDSIIYVLNYKSKFDKEKNNKAQGKQKIYRKEDKNNILSFLINFRLKQMSMNKEFKAHPFSHGNLIKISMFTKDKGYDVYLYPSQKEYHKMSRFINK